MFQYIRSLDPEARIAGPNFSSYYSNHYRDFLQFAKENNVIPDIVSKDAIGNTGVAVGVIAIAAIVLAAAGALIMYRRRHA